MTDDLKRPKGRGRVISALNMAIDGLNIAKEATNNTPINPIFGSVTILLTMIRVSFFLSRDEAFQAHTRSGHDGQRTGLCRYRAILRRYLQSARAGNGGKEVGRRQQVGA